MKHCLNCYRKLPNDALICHYCGAPQAEKEGFAGAKFSRCPKCMSYLYDDAQGCQNCGFIKKGTSRKGFWIFGFIFLLLVFFIFWQLGLFPAIPYGGKAAKLIPVQLQSEPTEPEISVTVEETPLALIPVEVEQATATIFETDSPTATITPIPQTATPTPFQCNGIENRLLAEQRGMVVPGGNPGKVRSAPDTGSETLKVLYANLPFTVLSDDPVCTSDYLWVKIRMDNDDVEGWTVEADRNGYWLSPLALIQSSPTP